ncbi:MAG TPA: hypothetical protein DCL21_03330, partial [Alphaproteobacteria bacterium]|nr:hypothetical protein [Alphaproteobacteria bacterium]
YAYAVYRSVYKSNIWKHQKLEPVTYDTQLINIILFSVIFINLLFVLFWQKVIQRNKEVTE